MIDVFDKNYLTIVNNERPFVFLFYSPLCSPCHTAEQIFNIVEPQYPELTFCHIDISKNPKIQQKFQIQVTPTILFIGHNGKILYVETGIPTPNTIHSLCKKTIKNSNNNTKWYQFWN